VDPDSDLDLTQDGKISYEKEEKIKKISFLNSWTFSREERTLLSAVSWSFWASKFWGRIKNLGSGSGVN
jgi:hypothetical protein